MASLLLVLIFTFFAYVVVRSQVLTPPYFNLAQGRNITATATCGEQLHAPDIYCRLTGGTRSGSENDTVEMIRGQLCDYCNSWNPDQNHSAFYATDGTEKWWQSPPLSRGAQYDQVNLTVHLGQVADISHRFSFHDRYHNRNRLILLLCCAVLRKCHMHDVLCVSSRALRISDVILIYLQQSASTHYLSFLIADNMGLV